MNEPLKRTEYQMDFAVIYLKNAFNEFFFFFGHSGIKVNHLKEVP